MRILGLDISFRKKDAITVQEVRPTSVPVSRIPTVKVAPLVYAQQFARVNRGVFFLAPEYDLSEIGKIEDVDSFVRQSFRKKEGLMFKEGVSYRGRNKATIQYVKTRMSQITQASGIPTVALMKRVAKSLIRVSNAYVVKVRSTKASGGQVRYSADGKSLQPIAAYFPAAPEMFKMDLDPESGKIRHWRQQLPNGWYKLFKPEDVIHFTLEKREGFSYGIPSLVPVIDDIRALRTIEENIELLLYQHLFPLFHYKVGTEKMPAGYTEDGRREIDVINNEIRSMPAEGMLVTDERAEIKAIGSEGRAMNAEAYLTYFKRRVYVGLGMSEVDFGETTTSNRAAAQVASRALVDSVKAIQAEFEAQWDQHIIKELLLESTFGDQVLEEDNMVLLQFNEIDIENKIKHEKHASEMFKIEGLTWDEFRNELGLEPIIVPENGEDQDPAKYPEWHNTHWKLFDEPLNLIRAVDEPYSPAAKAAVAARTTSMTSPQMKESEAGAQAMLRAKNAGRPDKAPHVKAKDSAVSLAFDILEKETLGRVSSSIASRGRIDEDYMRAQAKTWTADTATKMMFFSVGQLVKGFVDQVGRTPGDATELLVPAKKDLHKRIAYRLDKLAQDAIALSGYRIHKKYGDQIAISPSSDIAEELHIAFDAIRYRSEFIWDVETRKAYNYGRLLGMQYLGGFGFKLQAREDSCEQCRSIHGWNVIAGVTGLEDIPPFHANSRMEWIPLFDEPEESIPTEDDLNIGGSGTVPTRQPNQPAVEQPTPALAEKTRVCPRCGMTATFQPRNANFFCSRCKYAFSKNERPKKMTGGKPMSPMPPKKRKEEAELPASVGGPKQGS
jgi:ribosomal protein S27AE